MLALILRRLIQMALIMAVASLILFVIFDTEEFKKKIAVAELGGFAVSALSEEAYQNWLAEKGLDAPFYERFVNWVGDVVTGDFGHSFEKNTDDRAAAGRPTDQHRHPGVLGVRPDDPALAGAGRARRHEGGLGAGSRRSRSSRCSPPRFPRSRPRSS